MSASSSPSPEPSNEASPPSPSPSPSLAPEQPAINAWIKYKVRAAITLAALNAWTETLQEITKAFEATAKSNQNVQSLCKREKEIVSLPEALPNDSALFLSVFSQDDTNAPSVPPPTSINFEVLNREDYVILGENVKKASEKLGKQLEGARDKYQKALKDFKAASEKAVKTTTCGMESDSVEQFIMKHLQ